jgi:hypothetical protein
MNVNVDMNDVIGMMMLILYGTNEYIPNKRVCLSLAIHMMMATGYSITINHLPLLFISVVTLDNGVWLAVEQVGGTMVSFQLGVSDAFTGVWRGALYADVALPYITDNIVGALRPTV